MKTISLYTHRIDALPEVGSFIDFIDSYGQKFAAVVHAAQPQDEYAGVGDDLRLRIVDGPRRGQFVQPSKAMVKWMAR